MIHVVDVSGQTAEEWRPGVTTRMLASAASGAHQLCVFEQWCEPGRGAPTHMHAVEEILQVVEGKAEIWIEDERVTVTGTQLVVVPAGHRHGFSNAGGDVLHIRSTLASPVFEAAYDDGRETPRRWLPI